MKMKLLPGLQCYRPTFVVSVRLGLDPTTRTRGHQVPKSAKNRNGSAFPVHRMHCLRL